MTTTPCPLTASQYTAALAAFSAELSRQCEGVMNTAALACKTERADLLVQYLGLHEELSQIHNAVAAMRMMSRLYPESCTDILHEFEVQVSTYERAFKDFERRFIQGNDTCSSSDEAAERLHRMEVQLLRLGEIRGTMAELVAAQKKQNIRESRKAYYDRVACLSDKEAKIFQATSETEPLRGINLTAKAKLAYDGYSKGILAHLVKLGLLENVTGGYVRVPCPAAESQD